MNKYQNAIDRLYYTTIINKNYTRKEAKADLEELAKKYAKLEKALDIMCKYLAESCDNGDTCLSDCPFPDEPRCGCKCFEATNWKEWVLKDE